MRNLAAAIRFLTVFRFGNAHDDEKRLSESVVYFPVVGLLLGLVLVGANNLSIYAQFNPALSSALLVILLVLFTGGLHMDGLADTFDGLLSGRTSKDDILNIMRDPNIGTMGVLAIVSVIVLKFALLLSVSALMKPAALVLMCVVSRWSLVFSMTLFPYCRKTGRASAFIDGRKPALFIAATMIALLIAYLSLQMPGLLIFAAIAVMTYIFGYFMAKKLGGISGDTLGASCELNEVAILFCVYIISRCCL